MAALAALVRHAPRRSDPWPIGRRETRRLVGGETTVLERRGRSRVELALVLSIAIALTGLLGSLVIGPHVVCICGLSKTDTTKIKLSEIIHEALPQWSSEHGGKRCPTSLDELVPYLNSRDLDDSWGRPIELDCGTAMPSGPAVVRARSVGEDGRRATADDLVAPD